MVALDDGVTSGPGDQRVLYYYYGDGELQNATLQNASAGGGWHAIRQVAYTYTTGDNLELATVENAVGLAIDTTYYRYYGLTDSIGSGYSGALKYVFGPAAYARLVTAAVAAGSTAVNENDDFVKAYADHYYVYDDHGRVKLQTVNGFGSSTANSSVGQGTFSYTYSDEAVSSTGDPNEVVETTTETLPDGSSNSVGSDTYGLAVTFTS